MNRPETIEETAALVDAAGGRGIAVRVDHLVPEEVRALVAAHRARAGRPAHPGQRHLGRHHDGVEQDGVGVLARHGLRTLRLAVDTHAITSHFALPLLIRTPGGLVVEVTDGTDEYNADQLPGLVLLRPRQGGREPHGVRAGARAASPTARPRCRSRPAGCDPRRCSTPTASPRRTGATRPSVSRTSPSPRARRSSAARWPRWPRIPTSRAGTGSRCRAASWRRSTASPTSTAASPTPGATSSRCRTPGKPADVTGYR